MNHVSVIEFPCPERLEFMIVQKNTAFFTTVSLIVSLVSLTNSDVVGSSESVNF